MKPSEMGDEELANGLIFYAYEAYNSNDLELAAKCANRKEELLRRLEMGRKAIAELAQAAEREAKLVEALEEFVRFTKLPDTVNRGDYIRYQVKAIGAAEQALADRSKGKEPTNEAK